MANVKGHQKLARQFRAMADSGMVRSLGKALFAAGEIVEDRAKGAIMAGSASGKRHVPSRPGEPPNNDTAVLHNNIETVMSGLLEVEVSSNAPYSAALEFGTSRMAARPFMGPALHESKGEVLAKINEALRHELRKAAQ